MQRKNELMTSARAVVKTVDNIAQSASEGDARLRDELLVRARKIAPIISTEAVAGESNGTLAPASVAALCDTELFWCAVPKEVGGLGCDLVTTIEIIEEITRADGSSGWTLMANAIATCLAGAYLKDTAIDSMFGSGSRPSIAGMFGPGGKARQVAGGYQGSGKFSFGSGCAHANWMGSGLMVVDDNGPRALPSGSPEIRICFLPRERINFRDNWSVMGLEGTGSYDYEILDQLVPEEYTFERSQQTQLRGGTQFALGLQAFGCAGHSAIALGLMQRALAEVAHIAFRKKRPGSTVAVAESAVFKHGFSVQEANFQASRGYVLEVFRSAEQAAKKGLAVTSEQRQRFRQATTWAHNVASEVVGFCHLWAGSDAIRHPSPLGRCTRDMSVATQHVFVDQGSLIDAAPALLERWAAAYR
jgi:alkylation response protein AidB-like acyl-CoA dehydrogenase